MLASMFTELPDGLRIKPLRVEDMYKLIAAGTFADDERVELLNGVLVVMDPPGGPHIWITQRLMKRLVIATVDLPLAVICQSAVTMGDYQLPQPDLTVVPKQNGFRAPVGGSLVVELSDTSLRKDRDVKTKIYAQAGVAEYWIVDVNAELVFVHTDPHGSDYRMVTVVRRTGVLEPTELPGVKISVDELFRVEP